MMKSWADHCSSDEESLMDEIQQELDNQDLLEDNNNKKEMEEPSNNTTQDEDDEAPTTTAVVVIFFFVVFLHHNKCTHIIMSIARTEIQLSATSDATLYPPFDRYTPAKAYRAS